MTGGPLKPIQVIPPGLTGLLQLKQTGRLPDELADVVTPVIEMRDWYLTARRLDSDGLFGGTPTKNVATGVLSNQAFNAVAGVPIAVPQSEIWYVEQMTVGCSPTGAEVATDLVRFAAAIATATSGLQQLVGPDVSDYQLAARTRSIQAKSDRGFWALPGDQFTVFIFDNITTNGWTFALFLRATRCPI